MRDIKDLTGMKFGRLTALEPTKERDRCSVVWFCVCDCGQTKLAASDRLQRGYVKSCGCLNQERIQKFLEAGQKRHGIENPHYFEGDVCYVALRNHHFKTTGFFKIDAEDWERIRHIRWSKTGGTTRGRKAYIGGRVDKKNSTKTYLHRYLLDLKPGQQVDHIDRDPWNNCKSNLRVCTQQENLRYKRAYKTYAGEPTTSKYKGVWWNSNLERYVAIIKPDKDLNAIQLGTFLDEKQAALRYNEAAIKYFGEFAELNDVGD